MKPASVTVHCNGCFHFRDGTIKQMVPNPNHSQTRQPQLIHQISIWISRGWLRQIDGASTQSTQSAAVAALPSLSSTKTASENRPVESKGGLRETSGDHGNPKIPYKWMAYAREHPHKIRPHIWYSMVLYGTVSSVLGPCHSHCISGWINGKNQL